VTAYEYYAKGRQMINKFDPKSLQEARQFFTEALTIDPHALAYSGLGMTYIFHYIAHTNTDDLDTGITYLTKALELDDALVEPHNWLAYAYVRKHLSEKGIFHGKKAVALEPGNYFSYYFLAANYIFRAVARYNIEDMTNAVRCYQRSVELEPDYQWNHLFIGWFYTMYGNYSKALEHYQYARTLDTDKTFEGPRCIGYYPLIGFVLAYQGNSDEAIRSLYDSLEIFSAIDHVYKIPMIALSHCGLGYVYFQQSEYSDASNAYELAGYHALANNQTGAIDMLRRAIRYGWRDYSLLISDISFRRMRNDPEFQGIVTGLKNEPVLPELIDGGALHVER
jgi:tetratricopeptide (TPR) repeat protein